MLIRESIEPAKLNQRFNDLLAKQHKLLDLHRKQFEGVLNSDFDLAFLPENLQELVGDGLKGIGNYMSMLDSLK